MRWPGPAGRARPPSARRELRPSCFESLEAVELLCGTVYRRALRELERGAERRQRERRRVVRTGEVGRDDPFQPVTGRRTQRSGRLPVGKVSEASGDPALERPDVWPVTEHVFVVVELEEKRRRTTQEVEELPLHVPEVGGDDHPGVVRFEGVGNGLVGVVRSRERTEADVADPPLAAGLHPDERRKEISFETES